MFARCVPLLLTLLCSAVATVPVTVSAAKPTLVASVEPLAMALRDLYGDRAEVVTLLKANQTPHDPSLSPRQMLSLRRAELVVWLGPEAEPAVATLMKKRDGEAVALAELPGVTRLEGGHDHDSGHDHGHDHAGDLDPHLWLDPANLSVLARALAERDTPALATGQPERFIRQMEEARSQGRQRLDGLADQPWVTYHHPWGYLQAALGLAEPTVVSAGLGAGPGGRRFAELAEQIEAEAPRCAVLEPEAREDLVRRLCPDCAIQVLDPLGRGEKGGYAGWFADTLVAGFADCLEER